MPENPFDQLGLKKEVVASLRKSDRLDNFLKSYYRLLQVSGIHPDIGGDNSLCALVNHAHTEIRRNPGKIDGWIQTMQNGSNPEYLEMIEALVGRVESLEKVKDDYEILKLQYSQLLSSRAGRVDAPEIRKASPRARRIDEEPEIKRPSAKAGRVKPAEPEEAAEEREEVICLEPIVLTNISLYGLDGKPFITYKKAILDGEAVKGRDRKYLIKTADGWTSYYQARTDRKILPPLPLLYAFIERIEETAHPGKAGLLKDLRENWLYTSTRPDYKKNIVTHGYGFEPWELKRQIPSGNHYLDDIKDNKNWRRALRTLLMPKDLDRAIEVLTDFSGVRSYIWTPDADSRKSVPERTIWLGAYSDRLVFDADCRPGGYDSRSRGVVLEK